MRERGSSPTAPTPNQVIWMDPSKVDTSKSLKELMREGSVWILAPRTQTEEDLIEQMAVGSGPCKEST